MEDMPIGQLEGLVMYLENGGCLPLAVCGAHLYGDWHAAAGAPRWCTCIFRRCEACGRYESSICDRHGDLLDGQY